MTVLKLSLQK